MEQSAIGHAKRSLGYAREAIEALRTCKDFSEAARAWHHFLVAFYEVYEKLKAGLKENEHSKAWFKELSLFRLNDELLNYLYQARNNETHGLDHSFLMDGPLLETVTDPNATVSPERKGKELIVRVPIKGGKFWRLKMTMSTRASLIPFKDERNGKVYSVPKRHLGQKIPDMSIPDVAGLGLKYLETVVAEAQALVTAA
jgi:hypothetical protein